MTKKQIRSQVMKRLVHYIELMSKADKKFEKDLEDGGDPLSLIYQDVSASTEKECEEWLKN